jgi:hypothetical protein
MTRVFGVIAVVVSCLIMTPALAERCMHRLRDGNQRSQTQGDVIGR